MSYGNVCKFASCELECLVQQDDGE